MLSCYQTTLPLYMASTICTLINLICVIPLYLKFGLGLRTKNIWITVSYIPGKGNYDANAESRKKQTELEWMLNQKIFTKTIAKFQFQSEVDLFASRLNAKQTTSVCLVPS